MPMVVFGTFMMWFGLYGFNCGSALAMHSGKVGMLAAQVAMNTTIASAAGGVTVFWMRLAAVGKYDVVGLCFGILEGSSALMRTSLIRRS